MKARREHRVPLAPAPSKSWRRSRCFAGPTARTAWCFRSASGSTLLEHDDADDAAALGGNADYTVHGFRSTFRDWAGERTNFPREVVEVALAHLVGDEVERSYRRGDALEKRRKLMEAWAKFCEPKRADNIVKLARTA